MLRSLPWLALLLWIGIAEAREERRSGEALQPSPLEVTEGSRTFPSHQVLHGSFSSTNQCAVVPDAVWVEADARGDCLRYYAAGLTGRQPAPDLMVYLSGDFLLRKRDVNFVSKSYADKSPAALTADAAAWREQAGFPAMVLGRPGTYGSSGNHDQRRWRHEVDLVAGALDDIKRRYGVERFHLAGQSGGGHLVAALLNQRSDIGCAVISSGTVAIKHYWRLVRHQDAPAERYDPIDDVAAIARQPQPTILVLSDPKDPAMPFASQAHYVEKLREVGVAVTHVLLNAPDGSHHRLGEQARAALSLCVQGVPSTEIAQRLTAGQP